MAERDPLVQSYVHLAGFPRASEALHTLKKIASMVKPIMRARSWKVRELAEFYPPQANLLGLNVDRGRKICIRLRYPGDQNQFLPLEEVLDTMLHELCHNVHGPHDGKFHALWDQLRDEWQGLAMKGYTGEGFLSEGRRLGGGARGRIPPHEARRLAREAAEKRQNQPKGTGPGQRLGGAAPRPGEDIRRVILDAVQRRNQTLKGCATDKMTDGQIRDLADTATRNGFRTQAEEDEANEAAIAQAMWELAQEDNGKNKRRGGEAASSSSSSSGTVRDDGDGEGMGATDDVWSCDVCTLVNPVNFLCCDACGTERGSGKGKGRTAAAGPSSFSSKRRAEVVSSNNGSPIDLTADSPPKKRGGSSGDDGKRRRAAAPAAKSPTVTARPRPPPPPQTWTCRFCGTVMERQWWTCAACGLMKDSSR